MTIPNILWQTWKTNSIPIELQAYHNSWRKSNPQLEIRLCDDTTCSDFIKQEFGTQIYFLYSALPHPIMRADFWRLAILYIHGGYYADLDLACNAPIQTFVNQTVPAVFMRELNNIANFFIAAEPGHPVIKQALDYMIAEAEQITDKDTQSYGMHSLHRAVREYYQVIGTNYPNDSRVQILLNEKLKGENKLVHNQASLTGSTDYQSWRDYDRMLQDKRSRISDIMFFTTFNENGYDLYGKKWIESFIRVANVYPTIRAKIYYEGKTEIEYRHPNLEIVNFKQTIPYHRAWRDNFLRASRHDDYVKTMTVRFSYKSFVIQHALENLTNRYLIWLDGDCVFKAADYENFPANVLQGKFLACQVEENWDLNHVESGILIFDSHHPYTKKFNEMFKKNYSVEELVPMGQPYDGFVVFRSLLMSRLEYANLNQGYGRGGIQSDPSHTFLNPEIRSRFIHNIGWTGKHQYENWEEVFNRDDIYRHVQRFLFGNSPEILAHKISKVKSKAELIRQRRSK